jgi:hypothetical protein
MGKWETQTRVAFGDVGHWMLGLRKLSRVYGGLLRMDNRCVLFGVGLLQFSDSLCALWP